MGIHLGDVVVQDGEVSGDGVNIASRICALSEGGGICVSSEVYHTVRNQSGIAATPLGEHELRNVNRPVGVWVLYRPGEAGEAGTRARWRRTAVPLAASLLVVALVGYGIYARYREDIVVALILNWPVWFGQPIDQNVAFATAKDGTHIAYATTGHGPPVVWVITWLTHLERGLGSPVYDPGGTIARLSRNHLFVRYDGRGTGLSDRGIEDFSLDARVSDLEAVVDALGLQRFALLGISAGGPRVWRIWPPMVRSPCCAGRTSGRRTRARPTRLPPRWK